MILLFAAPPAAFADELSADAQAILDESGVDITDAAGWSLSDLCDTLGSWLAEGFQPALHFAAQAAGYLLLAGLLGLLAGSPYSGYVEILAVLGFGSLSLSTVMQLTELVAATAQDCRTYLTTFVPVFSGLAAAGGQVSGALVYSGMFLAMSGFLASLIQKLLLPIMQIYFCFAVCACLWGNHGIEDAAALFAPLFLKSLAYTVTFAAAGIVAGATGQKQCARLCHLYFEGARLCGSVLVLYFFMVFLSTALLLLAGNGGFG